MTQDYNFLVPRACHTDEADTRDTLAVRTRKATHTTDETKNIAGWHWNVNAPRGFARAQTDILFIAIKP